MQFLWHDYETFGTDPAVDRPCQFASLRTDSELRPLGEPTILFCAPAGDVLPRPAACLVTGITPQEARSKGVIESEFAQQIHALMTQPGTCSAGYNSLKFDDEVTRNLFYRNLLDPYEREWKNGNSRWDLINLARICFALRPDGIEWPMVVSESTGVEENPENGNPASRPSFKLQDLSEANCIEHSDAHDALGDVRATIELASQIRKAQPRLFDWALTMRDKQQVRKLLDPLALAPVVHTSGRIPAVRGCTTLVLPIAVHPDNDKAVIVFDLMGNAGSLVDSDAGAIRDQVFTPTSDLPPGVERLPLKTIKWNAVPMVAPSAVLAGVDLDRIGLDLKRCEENRELLTRHIETVRRSVREAFHLDYEGAAGDPDMALYSGGFFPEADRRLMNAVRRSSPAELAQKAWPFQDPRLARMLLRFRARNWPDSLDQHDWEAWQVDRTQRLNQPRGERFYGIERFRQELGAAREQHRADPDALRILDALEAWSIELGLDEHINSL